MKKILKFTFSQVVLFTLSVIMAMGFSLFIIMSKDKDYQMLANIAEKSSVTKQEARLAEEERTRIELAELKAKADAEEAARVAAEQEVQRQIEAGQTPTYGKQTETVVYDKMFESKCIVAQLSLSAAGSIERKLIAIKYHHSNPDDIYYNYDKCVEAGFIKPVDGWESIFNK